jgi:TldD protein
MSFCTRRQFLGTASTAVAGFALPFDHAAAFPLRSRRAVSALLPDLVPADMLRLLAVHAVDAARSAGATYADIRISDRRLFNVGLYTPPVPMGKLGFEYSYGIRVCVDGAWAFVYGASPSRDEVARGAAEAVMAARGTRHLAATQGELAPAPVVRGEWATPIEIDPFSVSPEEHAHILGAYVAAATRVSDVLMTPFFTWTSETRVFASSEGSLVTQRLAQFRPQIGTSVKPPLRLRVSLPVTHFVPSGAGFEAVVGPELQEQIKATTEEALQFLRYPEGDAGVGRFEAVLDGMSVGGLFATTLLPALEGERALGYMANESGTSLLSPPSAFIGQAPIFSTTLSAVADRLPPHYGAVRWDDDGVAPSTFPLVRQGAIVDYFTTRLTAPALASAYAAQGRTATSNGCAVTASPVRAPTGTASHVTVVADPRGPSLDDLTRQLRDGLLVRGTYYVSSDQQLSGGWWRPGMLFEVKRGTITRRLRDPGLQFSTKSLWKNLSAVGNASTTQPFVRSSARGQPTAVLTQLVTAPAGHVRELDLIRPTRLG